MTLANAGQKVEGVAAAEEAVANWRQLAAANPAAYEAALAGALSALSGLMSNAGRARDAVAVAEEAVDLLRRLAAVNPAAHGSTVMRNALFNITGALFNAGAPRGSSGRDKRRLRKSRSISPRLTRPHTGATCSITSPSVALFGRELGLSVDAMDVTVYRRLAAANAKAFEIYLAMSLHNLSVDCQETGDLQQAMATAEEAVIICRRLLAANFAVFDSRELSPSRF